MSCPNAPWANCFYNNIIIGTLKGWVCTNSLVLLCKPDTFLRLYNFGGGSLEAELKCIIYSPNTEDLDHATYQLTLVELHWNRLLPFLTQNNNYFTSGCPNKMTCILSPSNPASPTTAFDYIQERVAQFVVQSSVHVASLVHSFWVTAFILTSLARPSLRYSATTSVGPIFPRLRTPNSTLNKTTGPLCMRKLKFTKQSTYYNNIMCKLHVAAKMIELLVCSSIHVSSNYDSLGTVQCIWRRSYCS